MWGEDGERMSMMTYLAARCWCWKAFSKSMTARLQLERGAANLACANKHFWMLNCCRFHLNNVMSSCLTLALWGVDFWGNHQRWCRAELKERPTVHFVLMTRILKWRTLSLACDSSWMIRVMSNSPVEICASCKSLDLLPATCRCWWSSGGLSLWKEQEAEPSKSWRMHPLADTDRCRQSHRLSCRRNWHRRWRRRYCCVQNVALYRHLPCPVSLPNQQRMSIPFPYPAIKHNSIQFISIQYSIDQVDTRHWADANGCGADGNLVFATMMGGRALEVTRRPGGIRGAGGRSDAGLGWIDGRHPAPVFRWPRPWRRCAGWS